MESPGAYKWNIIEYPRKYDIIFHSPPPQEYPYLYSPRKTALRTHTSTHPVWPRSREHDRLTAGRCGGDDKNKIKST